MQLNERKVKILQAIINDYIETAEPVGSRTIAKKYNLGISSATIRNEMADLEELGLIVQPHSSAGRVPSDKGYRLYVDELMQYKELDAYKRKVLEEVIEKSVNKIDYLMNETAKAVALLTNYTAIVSKPSVKKIKIKHVQLVPLDDKSIIFVSATDTNRVQNYILNLKEVPDEQILWQLSNVLNEKLVGLTLEQINLPLIQQLKAEMGDFNEIVNPILDYITDTVKKDDYQEISLSGAKNILEFPEFNDIEKAKELFETFEEKKTLTEIVNKENDSTIQVIIGDENDKIKDCSLVKTTYKVGDQEVGTIGIIGPTRMDYAQVVSMLAYVSKNIDEVLQRIAGS